MQKSIRNTFHYFSFLNISLNRKNQLLLCISSPLQTVREATFFLLCSDVHYKISVAENDGSLPFFCFPFLFSHSQNEYLSLSLSSIIPFICAMEVISSIGVLLSPLHRHSNDLESPKRLHTYVLAWKILLSTPVFDSYTQYRTSPTQYLRECVESFLAREFSEDSSDSLEGHREFSLFMSVCAHIILGGDTPSIVSPHSLSLGSTDLNSESILMQKEKMDFERSLRDWDETWPVSCLRHSMELDVQALCEISFIEGLIFSMYCFGEEKEEGKRRKKNDGF